MKLKSKKILMIIAARNFRDEEFEVPYKTFIEEGAVVTVASLRKGIATGMFGAQFNVETTLNEVDEKSFDAVIFIGGSGVPDVRADKRAIEIAKNSKNHKVLAAVCWAPTILAKAGVVNGRKTTVWLGDDPEYGKKTSGVMEDSGAHFVNENVITDGNIVTGNGPQSIADFAEAIIKKLIEK